ncbi:MAG: hypothetical protein NZ480_07930, partial [Bdellovibrionaceae bacterium]|nr:hypothetical protein [Pseudobdellovibrionaceae bacterium]
NQSSNSPITKAIKELAVTSLIQNFETIGDVTLVTAGRNQFRSLWVRDFCFCVPALLKLGYRKIVKDQLELIINHIHPVQKYAPRTLDSFPTKLRILLNVFKTAMRLPKTWLSPPLTWRLKPEYLGEHCTPAFDSNILLALAILTYVEESKDKEFLNKHSTVLEDLMSFYQAFFENHLIYQPAFSDWQDSVQRRGFSSYINLLFWVALKKFYHVTGSNFVSKDFFHSMHHHIIQTFLNSDQLLKTAAHLNHISIDSTLLALNHDFFDPVFDPYRIWQSLVHSPLFQDGFPYRTTYPNYPKKEIAWTVRLIGLSHYHDELCWSWLIALTYKIAQKFSDSNVTRRIEQICFPVFLDEKNIGEIYTFKNDTIHPWKNGYLESERPFSWGAALWVEAIP